MRKKGRLIWMVAMLGAFMLMGGCQSSGGKVKATPQPTGTASITESANSTETANPTETAKPSDGDTTLTNLGRASIKLKLADGRVIYIDPYAGGPSAYKEPADLVLVTHQHDDHNRVSLCTMKDGGEIIQCPRNMKAGDEKTSQGVKITAVAAYNKNHSAGSSCGFVLDIDGFKIYHSGDTSMVDEMKALKDMKLDYALLCTDGYYNMGPEEAMEVAATIGAKHVIPIHSSPSGLYSQENCDKVNLDNVVNVKLNESVSLIVK